MFLQQRKNARNRVLVMVAGAGMITLFFGVFVLVDRPRPAGAVRVTSAAWDAGGSSCCGSASESLAENQATEPAAPVVPAVPDTEPPVADRDADGLTDHDENTVFHTDPDLFDTDGDGYGDGQEIERGYSPRHDGGRKLDQVDSDGDYLIDSWELELGTDLMDPDSDGDLYLDGTEVAASYDPLDSRPTLLDKLIKVDLSGQRLDYYFDDHLFGSFPVSTGKPATPTPEGEFIILDKVPVKYYGGAGFDYPNTKWNLHFTTQRWRYYIHGAYWHDNFGQPMSHGCVNVRYEDMESLYWWAQHGTRVVID